MTYPDEYAHEYSIIHPSKVYRAFDQAMLLNEFENATEASFDLMQKLIDEYGPNVLVGSKSDNTSLMTYVIAITGPCMGRGKIENNLLSLIRYLIHAGASTSPGPLIRAARHADYMVLSELLPYCDDPDAHFHEPANGYTALYYVVEPGTDMLDYPDPLQNRVNRFLLGNLRKCITLLIAHGADVRCMGSSTRSAWSECQIPNHPFRYLIIPPTKNSYA